MRRESYYENDKRSSMNKYEYLWIVQGYYQDWEDIYASLSWKEARDVIKDHRANEIARFRLIQRRILTEASHG
jgi:hypothetical protein